MGKQRRWFEPRKGTLLSDASSLRQRLRRQTGQARLRHARLEARTAARADDSPQPGDLYLLVETAESGIEWAVLELDPEGSRLLVVPADTNPLAGSADVAVPEAASRGPLTLRCAYGTWLAMGRLESRLRAGALDPEHLERALETRRRIASGAPAPARMDDDPEYREWLSEILEPARAALSRSRAPEPSAAAALRPTFFFEGFADDSRRTWRTRIPTQRSELIVGRRPDADLVLRADRVSKRHAELFLRDNGHWIRDLGSAGGTFVNRQRVTGERPIRDGDVVLFGDRELRYVVDAKASLFPPPPRRLTTLRRGRLNKIVHFEARFQPLVRLDDYSAAGYELFGAGELEGEPWQTPALFRVARGLGREAETADLRDEGMDQAERLPAGLPVLVSIDPDELQHEQQLTDSLRQLRARHPDKTLVIEVEETGAGDRVALEALSHRLHALGIDLAFHDFGTDRSRLEDLIQAHPRFVKFGRGWTRDLHLASPTRRRMVESLVRIMAERGISTVAEGIDNEEQGQVCSELGFELAQGAFFGSPTAAERFAESPPAADP